MLYSASFFRNMRANFNNAYGQELRALDDWPAARMPSTTLRYPPPEASRKDVLDFYSSIRSTSLEQELPDDLRQFIRGPFRAQLHRLKCMPRSWIDPPAAGITIPKPTCSES